MIVGLDIGTSSIRVAIGEIDEETKKLKIAGTSCEKSAGLRNGNIVNIEAASGAIRNAIEEAEQNAGVDVNSCFTAIGGEQIEGINSTGKVAVSTKGKSSREISQDDIQRVRDCAQAVQISLDREMLHVITQDYTVDHVSGIKDPMHRLGVCLESSVHIVTASKTTIQNIQKCINRAGYEMDGVILKTLAAAQTVATEDEMELGSILIDLGAGTTDFFVLVNGAPVCTASIPVGGNLVTNDIAIVEGINVAEAERIKLEAGCCWADNVDPSGTVIINGIGGQPPREVKQSEICDIISARIREIFNMVLNKIIDMTSVVQLSGNIILTGGGANLDGIIEIAQEVFETSAVRIGFPEKLGGIEEDYDGPEWATVIGLVKFCNEQLSQYPDKKTKKMLRLNKEKNKSENKFIKMLKSLF